MWSPIWRLPKPHSSGIFVETIIQAGLIKPLASGDYLSLRAESSNPPIGGFPSQPGPTLIHKLRCGWKTPTVMALVT